MDRSTWVNKKQRAAQERMDTLWAPIYDENWVKYPDPPKGFRSIPELVPIACPDPGCRLWNGKYWPMISASGRTVFGIDQSQGMLSAPMRSTRMCPASKSACRK